MACHSIGYPSSDHFPVLTPHSLPLNTTPRYLSFFFIYSFLISVFSLPTSEPFQVFWILQALQVKCTNVKMYEGSYMSGHMQHWSFLV